MHLLLSYPVVSSGHPVEDVISLLKRLGSQVEEEGKAEALTYQKFEYWCTNSKKVLEKAIADNKALIETLSEQMDGYQKDMEVLSKEIDALDVEIQQIDTASSVADGARQAGANLYSQEYAALEGTITAIGAALMDLVAAKHSTSSNAALIQQRVQNVMELVASRASASQRRILSTFTITSGNISAVDERVSKLKALGDYDDHVQEYSFKSSSVIELLKELRSKFEDEKLATEKAETNAINAYDLARQARADLRSAAVLSQQAKMGAKQAAESDYGTADGDRKTARRELSGDTAELHSTREACQVKASEWAERSKVREHEREAIQAAVTILAKVTGVRTERPEIPGPPPSPVSFLQLQSPKTARAVELLRHEAQVVHSSAIAQLAQAVAAKSEGPFDQVINAIEKMIFRLMHEQIEEDDHKNWCDKELSETNTSIEDKSDKIAELTVKIDDAQARAQGLSQGITAANTKVSEIVAHMKEAREIRKIGKEENAVAVKDAEAAQTALTQAIAVLKDFYKESGEIPKQTWEFIQRGPSMNLPEKPATWGSAYTAVADPVDPQAGIVGVLESVSADFAKMESDTIAQEETDQSAYQEDMKTCEIEKARSIKEAEMKAQERARVVDKQRAMESTRKGVSGEKEATEQYQKDLQPACVEGSSTYGDRKAARTTEIGALKQAQTLLQDAFEGNATNATNTSTFLSVSESFLQKRRRRV